MHTIGFRGAALTVLLAAALSACGGSGGNTAGSGTGDIPDGNSNQPAATAAPGGTADAEGINCGALTAPTGADVVGVSIGMGAEDARKAMACSNRALRVSVSDQGGFNVPPSPDGRPAHRSILAEGGQERIQAMLVGAPGDERVVTIRRTIDFAPDREPLVAELIAQLERKYGSLFHNPNEYGRWTGDNIRSADGQPIPPAESMLRINCTPETSLLQPMLRGECGLSVGVFIQPKESNERLATRLIVVMMNGSYGMQRIDALTANARNASNQQRDQETQRAQGRAPTL